MTGKQKCAILKQIRRDIAAKNDISITIEECTHKGNCKGTCPRCEAEVRMLERELEKKRKAGVRTVLAGVSAGLLAASLASCSPVDQVKDLLHLNPGIEKLEGDVPNIEAEPDPDTVIPSEPVEMSEKIEIETGEVEPDPDVCEGDDCEPLMGEPVYQEDEETVGLPALIEETAEEGQG